MEMEFWGAVIPPGMTLKVEVEEAMQKAIFALIKVGELLSVCKYGGARGPGTKSSAKTKVSCGYASTRKRFDWSPKSQDFSLFHRPNGGL